MTFDLRLSLNLAYKNPNSVLCLSATQIVKVPPEHVVAFYKYQHQNESDHEHHGSRDQISILRVIPHSPPMFVDEAHKRCGERAEDCEENLREPNLVGVHDGLAREEPMHYRHEKHDGQCKKEEENLDPIRRYYALVS
jgi:hypothetical protein